MMMGEKKKTTHHRRENIIEDKRNSGKNFEKRDRKKSLEK